jgi:hypothetical protein
MIKREIRLYKIKKAIPPMLLLSCWIIAVPAPASCRARVVFSSADIVSALEKKEEPNKPASERNHHLAGYALIAIGMLVIASESSDRLRPIGSIWPLLFIAAGLFLAAWSDGEIWPRGALSWTWLIHHDAEARQHKIYAILLIAMGILEYLRIRGKLSRFSRTWCFPILALAGVILLMFHDHTSGSGASSPEAKKYEISWFAKRETPSVVSAQTDPPDPVITMHHHESISDRGAMEKEPPARPETTEMRMEVENKGTVHQHHMSAAMIRVEQQHIWFALIGLGVVVFKFIHDRGAQYRSFMALLWPSCVAVLGVLLAFYSE